MLNRFSLNNLTDRKNFNMYLIKINGIVFLISVNININYITVITLLLFKKKRYNFFINNYASSMKNFFFTFLKKKKKNLIIKTTYSLFYKKIKYTGKSFKIKKSKNKNLKIIMEKSHMEFFFFSLIKFIKKKRRKKLTFFFNNGKSLNYSLKRVFHCRSISIYNGRGIKECKLFLKKKIGKVNTL